MTRATSDGASRRLRFASLTDVAALKALEDQSFSHDRLSARALANAVRSESQAVLILETPPAQIAGAAILHYRRRSRRCRLYSLAVGRDFSGRGLGTRLLQACEKEARRRGCEEIHLEVRTDRASTVRFYETRGFQKLALRPRYYEDGADAFSFSKAL
jgi:ribosomal-protein-alanine N-acetyltransferase